VLCSDEYLYQINLEYLQHDTYTDVITFPYSDTPDLVEGDIFVSVERVTDNAAQLRVHPTDELHRVMVHGLLHLLGYDDKTPESKIAMTQREDYHLSRRPASIIPAQ
jgi:rRNA maturation RNase YbeY